jgi:hypothetical protein
MRMVDTRHAAETPSTLMAMRYLQQSRWRAVREPLDDV